MSVVDFESLWLSIDLLIKGTLELYIYHYLSYDVTIFQLDNVMS